ncbi:MAG: hypothetical protein A2W31_00365 [Planctomycetes bacterium RBG_16_64_10]|nr:MAG: hypothetical protein A2W31_00365 [Planctomycetes bacterium RBG_16_64_10]
MRNVLVAATVLVLVPMNVQATNIWLSDVGTVGGGVTIGVPELEVLGAGELFIWTRPAQDQTLLNISLNVHTTTQGAIDLTGVTIYNPILAEGVTTTTARYEYVKDSHASGDDAYLRVDPEANPSRLQNFGGFSVFGLDKIGVGIGPNSTSLDAYYDAQADAWLLGALSYDVVGPPGSTTDLFLQIGNSGMTDSSMSSANVNVVFGSADDPALSALTQREQDSNTADARMTVGIPEPSALLLAVLAGLGLFGYRFCRKR